LALSRISRIASFKNPKQFYKEEFMKSKVIILTISAAFSLSGLALAEDKAAAPAQAVEQAQAPVVVGNTKCPVCNMEIPKEHLGEFTVEYNGKVYNVCSPNDQKMFLAQADRYGKWIETGVDPLAAPIPPTEAAPEANPATPDVAPAAEQK
jgi:YHS domain-containing protein